VKISFKFFLVIFISIVTFQLIPGIAYSEAITGPVLGGISSNFGFRVDPFNGITREHDGIDIAAPYGAPIYAMQDGTVIRSGWRGGYGQAITIDHYYPDVPVMPRIQTTYGHCSYLYVQSGQYVRRGQIIGLVGSTGRSTGPHLHFEVTYRGRPYPPLDYLMKLPGYISYLNKVRSVASYTSSNTYSASAMRSYR
jgi:murein DD-endopeptidase MepM/ murein hydrolase activator NlpD